jgi:hypothetical protein
MSHFGLAHGFSEEHVLFRACYPSPMLTRLGKMWQILYSARGRALAGSARERRDMGFGPLALGPSVYVFFFFFLLFQAVFYPPGSLV